MNRLREFRIRRLMTQKELAKKSGVCQVTISFTETDTSTPMDLTKEKLAWALKVPVKKLFPDGESKNSLWGFRVKRLTTQRELAKESGVDQTLISFAENSLIILPGPAKQSLAKALGTTVKNLFPEGEGKKEAYKEKVQVAI